MTVLGGSAAWAHYFDKYYADSAAHTYYIYSASWTTNQTAAITYAMTSVLDSSTDMYDIKYYSPSSSTDIKFMRGTYSSAPYSTYYAWVECNKAASSSVCDSFNLKLNTINPHPNYYALMCHEVGHTVGLKHWPGNNSNPSDPDNSCLRASPDKTTWNANQRGHINDRY